MGAQELSTRDAGRAGQTRRRPSNGARAAAIVAVAVVLESVGIMTLAARSATVTDGPTMPDVIAWILVAAGVLAAGTAVVVGALAASARPGRTLGLASLAAGLLTIYVVARAVFG